MQKWSSSSPKVITVEIENKSKEKKANLSDEARQQVQTWGSWGWTWPGTDPGVSFWVTRMANENGMCVWVWGDSGGRVEE